MPPSLIERIIIEKAESVKVNMGEGSFPFPLLFRLTFGSLTIMISKEGYPFLEEENANPGH